MYAPPESAPQTAPFSHEDLTATWPGPEAKCETPPVAKLALVAEGSPYKNFDQCALSSPAAWTSSAAKPRATAAAESPVASSIDASPFMSSDDGLRFTPERIVPWSSMCLSDGHAKCITYSAWSRASGSSCHQSRFL